MKIGINCLGMLGGRTDGGARYTRNLIYALEKYDKKNDYAIFVCPGDRGEFSNIDNPGFSVIPAENGAPKNLFLRGVRKALRVSKIRHPRTLRYLSEQERVDIMFHPGSMDLALDIPGIVCIHDIQHEYHPDRFPYSLNIRKTWYSRCINRAKHIVTVSDYSRRTILEKFKLDPASVSVIHNYIDPRFRPLSKDDRESVRRKYGLPAQFLLYPASFFRHKNHVFLLEAFAEIKKKLGPAALLFTGNTYRDHPETSYFEALQKIKELDLADRVFIFENLPDQAMPAIYALASLMVFPSLFEGFGIPVIEAMACGCPVACSNVTSLPEISGKAALGFDPVVKDSLKTVILRVLKDKGLRDQLIKLGFIRARLFSEERFAKEMLDLFEKVGNEVRTGGEKIGIGN